MQFAKRALALLVVYLLGSVGVTFAYLRNPSESVVIRLDAVAEAYRWSEVYPWSAVARRLR